MYQNKIKILLALLGALALLCPFSNYQKTKHKKEPLSSVSQEAKSSFNTSCKESDFDQDGISDSIDNDIDGDGIANAIEEEINADIFNKDTDGDGKRDGEEFKKDSDGDGILDILESALKDNDSDGVVDELDSEDQNPYNDSDDDGISNIDEKKAHTNPLDKNDYPKGLKDSDKDGLSDALEEKLQSNVLVADSDGDGKLDGDEFRKDSDGDGILDILESAKKDSDADGVVDELDSENSNPHNDSDEDGFSNIVEKEAHTNPLDKNSYPIIQDLDKDGFADNIDTDIDGDGLLNSVEARLHSNPRDPDSDGDGKLDGIEGQRDSDKDGKPNILESAKLDNDNDGVVDELDSEDQNPYNDSDGDGFDNSYEKRYATNPLNPNEYPKVIDKKMKENIESALKKLLLEHKILFEVDSALLTDKGKESVRAVALLLQKYPHITIEIAGYTDSDGDELHNLKLSQARVEKVKQELVKMGIKASRLIAKGYGEANPIVKNDTIEHKAINRRVEFRVVILKEQ